MTRSPHWVSDIEELVWYYRDSEAELGVRALPTVPDRDTSGMALELLCSGGWHLTPAGRQRHDEAKRRAAEAVMATDKQACDRLGIDAAELGEMVDKAIALETKGTGR